MEGGERRLDCLRALAAWLEAQPGTQAAWQLLEIADYGAAGFGFRSTGPIGKGALLCMIPVKLARAPRALLKT